MASKGVGWGLSHTCYLHLWSKKKSVGHNHCCLTLGKDDKVSRLTSKRLLALLLKLIA